MNSLLIALLILACVIVAGFFAASETVITSANRTMLYREAQRQEKHAVLLRRLLRRTEVFLGTTLVGTNLMYVVATTLSAVLVRRHVGFEAGRSLVNAVIMTPVILIIGELVPKALGRTHADRLILRVARPLQVFEYILYPMVVVSNGVAGLVSRLLGVQPGHPGTKVTREDLQVIAELAGEEGILAGMTVAMVQTVFELGARPIASVMVPLVDVVALPANGTVRDIEDAAAASGHTRFPIYERRVDDIIGIVDLRQVLYGAPDEVHDPLSERRGRPIRPFIETDAVFVPESKSVGDLLHELHYHKMPMAMVVDEHGGVVGLVTTEDLVEEIVGEIHDERDRDAAEMRRVGQSVYECSGKLSIRDLSDHLGLAIEPRGFETVAGLVLKLAGRIPAEGDRLQLDGYDIEVITMVKRRVDKVRFRRIEAAG